MFTFFYYETTYCQNQWEKGGGGHNRLLNICNAFKMYIHQYNLPYEGDICETVGFEHDFPFCL